MNKALDRIDLQILQVLQEDGRLSNKELAAKIGLAPSSALERVRGLREAGALLGARAIVDPNALGAKVRALVAVRLALHSRSAFVEFDTHIRSLPQVIDSFQVSGRDDFVLHVAVADIAELRDFTIDAISTRPEVAQVETSVIFEHVGPRPFPVKV